MPRRLRVEYPGAIYHVMSRGDRREDIFADDEDRARFLETLTEACGKTDWQVHAYCLMRNHYHLVVETPCANLCAGMQWFQSTYTARFNRRHRYFGHVFSGRYKALVVDGSGDGYLKSASDYVHLNPVRARLLKPEQRLKDYRWSSYPQYLLKPSKRWKWLRVDRVLGEWNVSQDNAAGRRQFEAGMEQRRRQEASLENGTWKELRRGWCFGPQTFREELLGMIEEQRGEHHFGEELGQSSEEKARQLMQEMLEKAGWKAQDLANRRKCDPMKVKMAAQLRAGTTMSWKWIAEQLRMGQWRSAANAVRLARE